MATAYLAAYLASRLSIWLGPPARRVRARLSTVDDRGDVPGWVMITVMTAALVIAILVPFRRAIVDAVQKAISDVTST